MALRPIPHAVRAAQARASDPSSSAFVSANAGSGKTHVLVQRVIRLLLDGVAPERILCITFTKAAAANMAERVFSTLGHWVTLDDAALDAAIVEAGIARPDARLRMSARKLFACALETPGGLKVQTIHALCTRLLQQFPFEANVPARFAVIDERDQNEMMERANLKVLLDASRDVSSDAGRALNTAMASAADVTFKDVVREACLSRDHFLAWNQRAGSIEAAAAQVLVALGVTPGDTIEAVEREIRVTAGRPGATYEVTAVEHSNPALHTSLERLPDGSGQRVVVTLEPHIPLGRFNDQLVLRTTSPRQPALTVSVFASVEGDVVVLPPQVTFGLARAGVAAERDLYIRNRGLRPLAVTAVSVPQRVVTYRLDTLEDGQEYRLTLRLRDGLPPGKVEGTVEIFTDHPDEGRLVVPLYAIVRDGGRRG